MPLPATPASILAGKLARTTKATKLKVLRVLKEISMESITPGRAGCLVKCELGAKVQSKNFLAIPMPAPTCKAKSQPFLTVDQVSME